MAVSKHHQTSPGFSGVLLRIFMLLPLVALAGCGVMGSAAKSVGNLFADKDNSEPPAELVEFSATTEIHELWSKRIGKGSAKQFLKLVPVASGEAIYTAELRGRVSAVNIKNGRFIWQVDANIPISGGPGVGAGLVMVGSTDGEILALSQQTGELRWRSFVSSEILAAPRARDDIVVVRTGDGKLFGLEARGGNRLWIYDRTVPTLSLRGTSAPALYEDLVIAGFDSGRLVALELATGRLVWETQIAIPRGRSDLERMVDIDAEPIIHNRTIYVATFQGKVAAVSLDSGRVEWSREISSHAGLAIDHTNVYLTDEQSHVWALDRLTGTSVWKQEQLHHRMLTAPITLASKVLVGDFEGYIHWLGSADGEFASRNRVAKSPLIAPPIVSNGVVIAYTASGVLAAYAAK